MSERARWWHHLLPSNLRPGHMGPNEALLNRLKAESEERFAKLVSWESLGADQILTLSVGGEEVMVRRHSNHWRHYPGGRRCSPGMEENIAGIMVAIGWGTHDDKWVEK